MKALGVFAMLGLLGATGAIAATDPFVGKWVLETSQSNYPAGECPKSMTIEMETVGNGVRYRSDSTYGDGRTTHAEYTAEYGGNQVLVTGRHGFMLPVSLKRIDAHTVVASYTNGLMVVATSRRVVSQDGRQMIITTTSKDVSGQAVVTIGVYEKQ
jgi:hypothetical protein